MARRRGLSHRRGSCRTETQMVPADVFSLIDQDSTGTSAFTVSRHSFDSVQNYTIVLYYIYFVKQQSLPLASACTVPCNPHCYDAACDSDHPDRRAPTLDLPPPRAWTDAAPVP